MTEARFIYVQMIRMTIRISRINTESVIVTLLVIVLDN